MAAMWNGCDCSPLLPSFQKGEALFQAMKGTSSVFSSCVLRFCSCGISLSSRPFTESVKENSDRLFFHPIILIKSSPYPTINEDQ